jgi:hypothetical protein
VSENDPSVTTTFYKREVNMGQLIGILIGLITLFGANWWDMSITSARNDQRIKVLEENYSNIAKSMQESNDKSDNKSDAQWQRINDKLELLTIKVENKKDK